jgi:uncharacterized protein YndB with AHSA1/START domain
MKGGSEMIKMETTVVINHPIEDVFAFVSNIEKLSQWAGPVLEAKQTSEGPVGVGTTSTRVVQFLGQRLETTHEVTEYEPNRKISFKSSSGPIPIEERFTFESVEDGTKGTFSGEVEAGGFFKLAEPIVARMLKRQMESDVNNLKELLEAQA